jgi:hypothetical protein
MHMHIITAVETSNLNYTNTAYKVTQVQACYGTPFMIFLPA